MGVKIKINAIDKRDIPMYQSYGASGFDLYASHSMQDPISVFPGMWALIPTGIRVEIPGGYEMQVRSRSGLSLKKGVFVMNSPGTIDSDYRGEIGVILFNASQSRFTIQPGDRIAQGVLSKVYIAEFENGELSYSTRGDRGFGSTGM